MKVWTYSEVRYLNIILSYYYANVNNVGGLQTIILYWDAQSRISTISIPRKV